MITNRDIERDRAQCEAWSLTVKALSELLNKSTFSVAEQLVNMPKHRLSLTLATWGGVWGRRLMELGGAK